MLDRFIVGIIKKVINQVESFLSDAGYPIWLSPVFAQSRRGRRGIIVSVTTRCNFQCPHCLRGEIDKRKTLVRDLPVSALETALREAKKINFQFVSFTGGEPILHPHFAELVSLACKYGYKFNFATNGWLHKEYWEKVIRPNRDNLEVIFLSLDGITPDVHDSVRNKTNSFERVTETISFYRSHNLPLIITFCVTKKNLHQIEKLPEFCLGLGIKTIKWATAIPIYDEAGSIFTKDILTDDERTEALNKIFNLREKFKFQCAFLITNSFYPSSKNVSNYLCPALDGQSFYIDHDAGMLFCCDLNRECKDKPLIQEVGFEESLKITMDAANEMKKRFLSGLLNDSQKINRICDFCNKNIKSCLALAVSRQNNRANCG